MRLRRPTASIALDTRLGGVRMFLVRWGNATFMFLGAVLVLGAQLAYGELRFGWPLGVFLLLAAVIVSPALYWPTVSLTRAEERAQDQSAPIIFVKAGCSYCIRMRIALGLSGRRAAWVDITTDPAAAAQVRLLNDGNETTPTVIASRDTRTNPLPSWVRDQLPA